MNRAVIGTGFPFRRTDDFKGYMMSFMRVADAPPDPAARLRRA